MNLKWVSLAGVLSLTIATSFADDWPQWRGPNRDAISRETKWNAQWPESGPKQLWQKPIGVGYGSMAVAKDRVFVIGNENDTDSVFCFDANSGKEVWKHSYPCSAKDPNGYPGPRSTPTVNGKYVYSVGREGQLFCLDAAKGKVIWQKNFQTDYGAKPPTWGFSGSPLIEKNMLIVETGGKGASVIAFDKNNGKEIWKAGDDPVGYSSPIAFDLKGERVLTIFAAKDLIIRSAKDGKELFRTPWKTSWDVNAATPIIDGDKVFISSGYGTGATLLELSENPPKEIWRNKNMRNQVNSSVLWNGYLYGFDGQAGRGVLKCLDFKTGDEKWSQEGFGTGSLIVAGGKLLIYGDKGQLATAEPSPEGFKQISKAQPVQVKKELPPNTKGDTWALPVLANGKIYLRNLDELVCLDVKR